MIIFEIGEILYFALFFHGFRRFLDKKSQIPKIKNRKSRFWIWTGTSGSASVARCWLLQLTKILMFLDEEKLVIAIWGFSISTAAYWIRFCKRPPILLLISARFTLSPPPWPPERGVARKGSAMVGFRR